MTPTRKCKACGEAKAYIEVDKGYGKRRFVDSDGGMWNGKRCYACHLANMRERNAKEREREREFERRQGLRK